MRQRALEGLLLGLILLFTACQSGTGKIASEKAKASAPPSLRPPNCKAPKGKHYQSNGNLLPKEMFQHGVDMMNAVSGMSAYEWEGLQPSDSDYARMETMLSDERLVGDGEYLDAGNKDGSWSISLYGTPTPSDQKLRLYLHGDGVGKQSLKETFGTPGNEKKSRDATVLIYGHVAAIFDLKDKFVGVVHFCPIGALRVKMQLLNADGSAASPSNLSLVAISRDELGRLSQMREFSDRLRIVELSDATGAIMIEVPRKVGIGYEEFGFAMSPPGGSLSTLQRDGSIQTFRIDSSDAEISLGKLVVGQ